MYFWKQDHSDVIDEPPEFTIDAAKEFKQQFDKLNKSPQELDEDALEFLVMSWLTEMARTGQARVKDDPSVRWLADSGLIASLERLASK